MAVGSRSSLCYRVRRCLNKQEGRKERTKKYKQTRKTIKEVTILVMVCEPAPTPLSPALTLTPALGGRDSPWCSLPATPALRGPESPTWG